MILTSSVPVMEVRSFHISVSEIRVLKFAKAAASDMSARGKTACVSTNIAGPRGEGKPIKLIDWRRKSFARHSGGRAEKISGAGSSRRLQPLNGLRSLEA